jgi:glucan phosphoethanolaminetransferase (alkaline phosphatase superfamily)
METNNNEARELKNQLLGWILFVICAVLFILSGIRFGDVLMITASVIFLLACVVFLVPLIKALKEVDESE